MGQTLYGKEIYSPQILKEDNYDVVIITSAPGLESITRQCEELGVLAGKIVSSYVKMPLESRRIFLKSWASMVHAKKIHGACAEAGVFEGDFAKYINEYFPERKLYLFDTFEGEVLNKMPFLDNCLIYKGYFPESAEGINEQFIFVNLDFDLYLPTHNGLNWFSKRMVQDGIILVHDYFADNFRGPREAVDKFLSENGDLRFLPIGDGLSIAIIGF